MFKVIWDDRGCKLCSARTKCVYMHCELSVLWSMVDYVVLTIRITTTINIIAHFKKILLNIRCVKDINNIQYDNKMKNIRRRDIRCTATIKHTMREVYSGICAITIINIYN